MKIFKNKKIKFLFFSMFAATSVATSIALPLCVNKSEINDFLVNKENIIDSNVSSSSTYNLEKYSDNFLFGIDSLEKLDYLLNKNNRDYISEMLIKNGVLPSDTIIDYLSFDLNRKNVNLDNYIMVNVKIYGYSNIYGNIHIDKLLPTGIYLINLDSHKLNDVVKNMDFAEFNQSFGPGNIKQTLFSMDIGLNSMNTKQITSNNFIDSDAGIWHFSFEVELYPNYVYLTNDSDFSNTFNFNFKLNNLSDYKINKLNLITAVNKLSTMDEVNRILNSKSELNSFIINSNFIDKPELYIAKNDVEISGIDNNGYIVLDIKTTMTDGFEVNTSASTNLRALYFDSNIFKFNFMNQFKSQDSLDKINVATLINSTRSMFVANSNNTSSGVLAPINVLSNKSTFKFNNKCEQVGNNWYGFYDLDLYLNDNYCFYDENNNKLINQFSLNNINSNIPFNTNISNLKEVISSLFANMTLDNYVDYFKDTNYLPNKLRDRMNPGRITPKTLDQLTNNVLGYWNCSGFTFRESKNIDNDPYVSLDVTINLRSPYTFEGNSSVTFSRVPTKIFNINGNLNRAVFVYSNFSNDRERDIVKIDYNAWECVKVYSNNKLYFPADTYSISPLGGRGMMEPGGTGCNWPKNYATIDVVDATFAQDLTYLKNNYGFFRARVKKFDFSNLPNLIGSPYGGSRKPTQESKYYFAECTASEIYFDNCPKLKYLGNRGWFKSINSGTNVYISLENCLNSLEYLPQDTFMDYSTYNHSVTINLKGTNIINADKSAFYNFETCYNNGKTWVYAGSTGSTYNTLKNSCHLSTKSTLKTI